MANTTAVYARIDTNLKEGAENILKQLGIAPSAAIQMLYSQIILTNGFPLDLHLHVRKPVAVKSLTQEELNAELQKGVDSLKSGRTYTAEEVETELARRLSV